MLEEDAGIEALLRLCAATDRGQRSSAAERNRIAELVAALESEAKEVKPEMLNGNWRLVYASEAAYRSSPFFWAFRQALAGSTTPVALPGGGVQKGDPVAAAVYAITDGLPFYNIGPVCQIVSGVGGPSEVQYAPGTAPTDGASSEDEPSDGTSDRSAFQTATAAGAAGSLVSRVELRIPLFGLSPWSSIMTTVATLTEVPPAAASPTPIEMSVGVETTTAKESTLAALLPQAEGLLGPFPSGNALELASAGSSKVRMLTTFLTDDLRVSRPMLALEAGAQSDGGLFVYARSREAI